MKIGAIIIILGALYGCSSSKIKEYEGVYTYGHEIRIFEDSKSGKEYWITGNEKIIKNLKKSFRGGVFSKKLIFSIKTP